MFACVDLACHFSVGLVEALTKRLAGFFFLGSFVAKQFKGRVQTQQLLLQIADPFLLDGKSSLELLGA